MNHIDMEEQREIIQSSSTRLYEAALKGDVPSFLDLVQEDPLILDRLIIERLACFSWYSPLHVAVNLGHSEFTAEILRRKPELAEELDHSKRTSPLHVASSKGHLDLVKILLNVNPDMCLVRDQDGWNPAHAAAVRGHVHVLDVLVRSKSQAARERTNGGDTILHLCVKHCQIEVLKFLVHAMDDGLVLNSKDSEGNTVLHLAVAAKQPEMVKFLLKDIRMEKNVINKDGLTAMDTYNQSKKDKHDTEIWRSLRQAKALRAKDALKPRKSQSSGLENQRNALMVVSSLIATMAFQAGVNPPGGVWQDNNGHKAGTSILADVNEGNSLQSEIFFVSNTVGLVSSLSVILLLISGLPCKKLFVGILMVTMWVAVTATIWTYLLSVAFLASTKQDHHGQLGVVQFATGISMDAWICLMVLLLVGNIVRQLAKLIKQLVMLVIKAVRRCFTRTTGRPPV